MPPPAEGFAARFVVGPALRAQPDRRLVDLVREGYENAFEEIVRRYGKPLTRYAAAIVGSRAEDVTQDAFSKALLALRRDGREIELRPWLFRIVRNTALNDLRDRPPSAETLAQAIAGGDSPEEELERREELADLMRRLRSLPEAQRAAIVMRELEGLSHEEIASALGLSGGGARQAIFRARRALRDGAGMLLPLPLLKALLAGAASAPVEAAAGAAGVGGVAGTGVAIKAATATVLVAGVVGAGVAVDHDRQAGAPRPARTSGAIAEDSSRQSSAASAPAAVETGDDSRGSGNRGRGGEAEPGDDRGGHPGEGGHGQSGHGSGGDDDTAVADDHGGNRGPGGDNLEPGDDDGGHRSVGSSSGSSGPGGGGTSGSDDGVSSGSGGSGGSDDGIGSGSGSSSGSGSGENSGSGSGDGSGSSGDSSSDGGDSGVDDSSGSGGPGDSHDGDGFSMQTEPQS
jgi:RNA polymerase sigma factor (sigma-70 family)